jgi:hypothetical protein
MTEYDKEKAKDLIDLIIMERLYRLAIGESDNNRLRQICMLNLTTDELNDVLAHTNASFEFARKSIYLQCMSSLKKSVCDQGNQS